MLCKTNSCLWDHLLNSISSPEEDAHLLKQRLECQFKLIQQITKHKNDNNTTWDAVVYKEQCTPLWGPRMVVVSLSVPPTHANHQSPALDFCQFRPTGIQTTNHQAHPDAEWYWLMRWLGLVDGTHNRSSPVTARQTHIYLSFYLSVFINVYFLFLFSLFDWFYFYPCL